MDNFSLKNGIFQLSDQVAVPSGALQIVVRDGKTGRIKNVSHYKNMFVTSGKQQVAGALRGNVANGHGQILYMELGTGTRAPALSDVTLQTPLFRKLISVASDASNVATFQTFFATSEAIGNLQEAGLFGGENATISLSSGAIFCRTNISHVKSSNDTLTITWNVTIG